MVTELVMACCGLLWLVESYFGCGLLQLVEACCDLLQLIEACCGMLLSVWVWVSLFSDGAGSCMVLMVVGCGGV